MNNVPTQCQQDRINMIETTAREKLFTPLYDRLQSVCVCGKLFLLKKKKRTRKKKIMDAQSYRPLTHTIHLISSLTGANIKVSKSNTYEKIFSRHVVTFLGKFSTEKKRSTNNNFFSFLNYFVFFSNYIFLMGSPISSPHGFFLFLILHSVVFFYKEILREKKLFP